MPTLDATDAALVADAVWDEIMSGHRIAGSFGALQGLLLDSGNAQGSGAVGSSTITLAATAPAVGPSGSGALLVDKHICLISGTGAPQVARISSYNPTTKVATIAQIWELGYDATTFYVILSDAAVKGVDWARIIGANTAQNFSASTIGTVTALGATAKTDVTAAVPTVAQVRAEMDSNSADLNTIVAAGISLAATLATMTATLATITAYVDELESRLTALRAGYLDNLATAPPTANANADALLDRAAAIDGYTPRNVAKLMAAAALGTGAGTTSDPYQAINGTSGDRVAATFDSDGARAVVTKTTT